MWGAVCDLKIKKNVPPPPPPFFLSRHQMHRTGMYVLKKACTNNQVQATSLKLIVLIDAALLKIRNKISQNNFDISRRGQNSVLFLPHAAHAQQGVKLEKYLSEVHKTARLLFDLMASSTA